MREMKDSENKFIQDIPKEWNLNKVKRLFYISRGRVIDKTTLVPDGMYPVYSSQTKNDGCFGYINTFDYDGDSITWTTDGANAGSVFLRTGKYNCTNVCGILTPKKEFEENIAYITYALKSLAIYHKRYDINGYKIMSNEMAEIQIPLPPLTAQIEIKNYLDNKCAQVDSLITNVQTQIEKLKAYKQSLITEVVTKGLDPTVPMKDSGFVYLGNIPSHWRVEKIKYHLRFRTEKNKPNAEILSLYRELGVVPKNSRDDNHNVTSEDTSNYRFVRCGDFVVNKMKAWQGSAAVSKYEGIVSPAYFVYEFTDNEFEKAYFHFLIRNKNYATEFTRMSAGIRIGQWDLSRIALEDTFVLIPPIEEQQQIADYLDEKCAQIDRLLEIKQQKIEKLNEYKKSLIYEYVTGKREV